MSYEVVLDEWVIEQLEGWALPDAVLDGLGRLLEEELAADPIGNTTQIVAPIRTRQYNCQVVDPDDAHTSQIFLLRFYFTEDERSLVIWDAIYFAART